MIVGQHAAQGQDEVVSALECTYCSHPYLIKLFIHAFCSEHKIYLHVAQLYKVGEGKNGSEKSHLIIHHAKNIPAHN